MGGAPRERLLHRLGGTSPIGLAAFDRKLRYTAINDWLAEFNGSTVEGHIGRTMREMAGPVAGDLEPTMHAIFDGGAPVYGIPVVARDQRSGELRSTEVSFFGLDDPSGRRMALGCVVVDMTQRERALSRVALLQDAIMTVTAASDAVAATETLVTHALEALDAQGIGIAFAADDEELEFIAVAGRFGEFMRSRFPRVPIAAEAPLCDAYRSGRSIWLPTRDAWRARYRDGANLVEAGAASTFVVPLEAEVTGRRIGVLGVVFDRESALDADDLSVVGAFAQQAAQTLDRILLHDSERAMRERFELLATLSVRLDDVIEPEDRIGAFLDVVVPGFAAVARVDLDEDELHAERADPARRANESTDQLVLTRVPLVAHGGPFGSVTFGRDEFSSGDHALCVELTRRFAATLENARLYARERELAETLQLSLLPRSVPDIPGVKVWARYLPGTDLVVGGDFWDVIELPFQQVLLVVGDVAGRGEPAAIVMGRLRTVIRAFVGNEATPAGLMAALNRFLVDHEDEMATCLCAVLDQTTGVVRVANAGHPPLLKVDSAGEAVYLGAATGLPLGIRSFVDYGEEEFTVAPGETLVLFTDGLVERRDETIDARFEQLAQRARRAIAGAGDAWCDDIVDSMIGARRDDDVALLGVRLDEWRTPELRLDVPAELQQLRIVRDRMRAWLVARDVSREDVDAVLLAVGEASGNVAMHAYGARGGRMRVHAALADDCLRVTVRDDGRWRTPRDHEGRGLQIIEQMSDASNVASGPDGTTVMFERRLRAVPAAEAP
jgi:serine phosphatase RsbU (regulator of sigma subunit)/anti-sigma regulatory factor (Ser/Thr protein kinase)